jgi:hypothetical protein
MGQQVPDKIVLRRFRYIDYVTGVMADSSAYERNGLARDREFLVNYDTAWLRFMRKEFQKYPERYVPVKTTSYISQVINQLRLRVEPYVKGGVGAYDGVEKDMDYLRENDGIWFRVNCPSNLSDIKFRYLRYLRGMLIWNKQYGRYGEDFLRKDKRRLRDEDHRWLDTTDSVDSGLSMFYRRDIELDDTRELRQYEAWFEQFDEEMRVKERYVRYRQGKIAGTSDEEFLMENCPQWLDAIDKGMLKYVKRRYARYANTGVEYDRLIADINCLIRNDKTWFNRTRPFPKIEQPACPICHIEFKRGAEIWTLRCGHYAHPYCLRKWFEVKRKCPICRRVIRDIDIRAGNYGPSIFGSRSLSPTP